MLVAGTAVAIVGGYAASTHVTPVSADTQADRDAAARVRAAIASESKKIAATSSGLKTAEARLAKLQARETKYRTQFVAAQDDLVRARVRLTRLEQRSDLAKKTLGKTLAAAYRRGTPDLVTILVEAHGIRDATEQVQLEQAVQRQNSNALSAVRSARKDAAAEEKTMQAKETKFQSLAKAAAADRDAANAVKTALLRRQATQLAAKKGKSAQLATLQARIRKSEMAQIAAAKAAANVGANTTEAPKITGTSDADGIVAKVVAAANQIASTPYVWGGGHGSFQSSGYDCSGSVSYALAAGGLLSSPLTSGGLMSWGLPGPGQRITVYANAGHTYMYVDGRRYDTSALSSGGTRWTSAPRSNAGFVARHPAGL
ncbi:MAG: hypothetical protein AAGC46_03265 [Solirubrobacteraceae bacterium]|nr:hypothetical protein [Patulibacter sp.]